MINVVNSKDLLDISDLRSSLINLTLFSLIVELNEKVEVLTEIIKANKMIDPIGLDVVRDSISNKPEYKNIRNEIEECLLAINEAQNNPDLRLKAMFKAKMEGRI